MNILHQHLHMYRTLYQAGMYKIAFKKRLLPRVRAEQWREI